MGYYEYDPAWESLANFRTPAWYEDAKFGIFIHWGVYSVPAFGNEWYPRNMYLKGTREYEHHLKTYGPHHKFGYIDFIPQFTATNFNPDAWMRLFKESGARYVVPVAEHHDGFALYDYRGTGFRSTMMGPKRDIIGELAAAARAHDLIFGVSSHRAEHWWFFDGGTEFKSDIAKHIALYNVTQRISPEKGSETWRSKDWQPRPNAMFLEDWLARTKALVDQYQPQLIWFDWWIEQIIFEPYLQRFAAYYYNQGVDWEKGVAINYKHNAFPEGTAVLDIERGQLGDIRPLFWQTDTSVSKNSWGYIADQDYKNPTDLIGDLVDIVSKNGALLLNIGPKPDGTIPEPEQAILREIGAWLKVNGDAIYGTRPWKIYGEGPTLITEGSFTDTKRSAFTGQDFRFTTKGDDLYTIALAWPGKEATITALRTNSPHLTGRIERVQLLGGPESIPWQQDENGLHLTLPAEAPGNHAFTFRITLSR